MSYILDALKKAESERRLGSVPDVYAQPAASLTLDDQGVLKVRPWGWGVLLVLLAILSAVAWTKPWRSGGIDTAAQQAQPASAVAEIDAIPATQPAPLPRNAAVSTVAGAPTLTAAATSATLPAAPAPTSSARSTVASSPEPVEPRAGKSAETRSPQLTTPPDIPQLKKVETSPPPVPAPEIRIPTLSELPEMIQKEIPALTFGGYLYSSKPADRTVLINNRLLHEGDQVAPGLTLEKMMPKEAVLNYAGYRYRVSY